MTRLHCAFLFLLCVYFKDKPVVNINPTISLVRQCILFLVSTFVVHFVSCWHDTKCSYLSYIPICIVHVKLFVSYSLI